MAIEGERVNNKVVYDMYEMLFVKLLKKMKKQFLKFIYFDFQRNQNF